MTTIKKRLPIILAIIAIALIIALPLFLKNKKQTAKSVEPEISPSAQILGENISSISPAPTTSPTPTPTKKSPAPKLSPTPTPIISVTSVSPIPTSTPAPTLTSTPTPTPVPAKTVTVEIQNLGTYTVEISENDTAYDVLTRAGKQNNFAVTSEYYAGMGYFVTGIGGVTSHDNFFWAFYYNGASSMVGASAQKVSDGDTTAWKFESW